MSVVDLLGSNTTYEPALQLRKVARQILYFLIRYIDDVVLLNNSIKCDFVDRIYPIQFEAKNSTDPARYVSYLDLHIEIDSDGQ